MLLPASPRIEFGVQGELPVIAHMTASHAYERLMVTDLVLLASQLLLYGLWNAKCNSRGEDA